MGPVLTPDNPHRPGRPDPEGLFKDLSAVHTGTQYSDPDRYKDFRAVFLSHPRGKKVLYEILTWAHMFQPVFVPGDAYATHYRDGERNIGLKIMTVLNAEPSEQAIEAEEDPDTLQEPAKE